MDSSQWNNWFLTPSTTPTDATFSPSTLQTPRSSTHFQDAFSPYGQQHNVSGTPFTSMEQLDANMFDQAAMAASYSQNSDQSHFLMSPKHTGAATFQQVPQANKVQTPPSGKPESKRRIARPHSIMFGTPSSMDQVLNGQHQHAMEQSRMGMMGPPPPQPGMAMGMEYGRQHMHMGPPQQQGNPYWNMSQAMGMQPQQVHSLADPFIYQAQPEENLSSSNDAPGFMTTTPQLFTPAQGSVQQAPVVPSNVHKPLPPVPGEAAPNMLRGPGGVDPTLLYSSPNRMAPPGSTQPMVPVLRPTDSMSPEKPISQVAFATPAGKSMVNDHLSPLGDAERPSSGGGLRSGPRRLNTAERRRPHSMYGSIESLSRSNSNAGIQRRASPLKRCHRNSTASLASILEASTPHATTPTLARSRTSIVLTIDSEGRARAETRPFDPSPTKAMQARYPNLWNDSDSESDSDGTTSSSQLLAMGSKSERRHRGRIDSTVENLEGLSLPRSQSSTSLATPVKNTMSAAAHMRRQSSVKKSYAHSRRNTLTSNVSIGDRESTMSASSDEDKNLGDAGAALRKAMERRDQHREQSAARRARANSRPTLPPRSASLMELTSNSAPHFDRPTTSHGPSPVRPQNHNYVDAFSSLTKCICNGIYPEGQVMVQCTSCRFWSHAACLGMQPHQIPQVYYCSHCLAAPPQMNFHHHHQQAPMPLQMQLQQLPRQPGGWEAAAAF